MQDSVNHKTAGAKVWLSIIGIGEEGIDGLGWAAGRRLQEAEFIFGGVRHLAFLDGHFPAERIEWPKPFADSVAKVQKLKGCQVALLMSGDPMFYGAGAIFLRYFSPAEVDIYPHVSSFSLAASRLGWSLQDVQCCSAHGRPLSVVLRFLEHGARLLILAHDGGTPALISAMLRQKGFAASTMTVLEHLGGAKENIVSGEAGTFEGTAFCNLNIIALDCVCHHAAFDFPRFSVLPDHAFIHDGQLTKQDVRAVTLARLAPRRNELLWDVGAGCGSVSLEWLRLGCSNFAIAIEQKSERCDYIRQNAENLGFPELQVIEGKAPSMLAGLKSLDAVFIGGGVSDPEILKACWRALKPGGRLVANAVTLEGEAAMMRWGEGKQTHLIKFAVSSAEPLGRFHVWRPMLPFVIISALKTVGR